MMPAMNSRWVRVALIAALSLSNRASAGRTSFGQLFYTETLPQRGVELETWVLEENKANGVEETRLWWSPVVGVTDRLELALPIEFLYSTERGGSTSLDRFGADVRLRLTNPDPVESGPASAL